MPPELRPSLSPPYSRLLGAFANLSHARSTLPPMPEGVNCRRAERGVADSLRIGRPASMECGSPAARTWSRLSQLGATSQLSEPLLTSQSRSSQLRAASAFSEPVVPAGLIER
jgi:hypothetical protein